MTVRHGRKPSLHRTDKLLPQIDENKRLELEMHMNNNLPETNMNEENLPEVSEMLPEAEETKEIKGKKLNRRAVLGVVAALIVAAAISVLVATLWMPVLQIYGSSMEPTLTDGQIVVSFKVKEVEKGDIIAFYYNNKILIKRVIGTAGDWVNISDDGTVFVNDEMQEEPYIPKKAEGSPDIMLPYQVPDSKLFVMGDNRGASADSRHTAVGCVAQEQIVGKVVFCVWPLGEFGMVR